MLLDGAAGAALVMAMLLVFLVDRFVLSRGSGPSANTLLVNVIDGAGHKRAPKRLKLAVTPTQRSQVFGSPELVPWDDMGKLLNELGEGYQYDVVDPQQFLLNPQKLGEYDVLFLTCASRGEELKDALFEFVANGGVLYASDWRYKAVATAFPDMVEPRLAGDGAAQQLEADIVDPALRELIGPKIHLRFDMPQWKTAAFGGPRVKTLIQGSYTKFQPNPFLAPQQGFAPLMVKFNVNKGAVIFTSFHNEKQNSEVEKKLLQYLVFSLVTAGVDAEINTTMDQGGFAAQRSNLLSTPKKNQSISKTYDNKAGGGLRFALGFRNEGAKLRFAIKAPDGRGFTWEGSSTVILEVPNAATGTWTYTVTDLELPYENFPFTVTVGEKR
jgi:hypothetical protein